RHGRKIAGGGPHLGSLVRDHIVEILAGEILSRIILGEAGDGPGEIDAADGERRLDDGRRRYRGEVDVGVVLHVAEIPGARNQEGALPRDEELYGIVARDALVARVEVAVLRPVEHLLGGI